MNEITGIVKNGKFVRMVEAETASRLTTIAPQEAVPPESREVDLSQREGQIIRVQGSDQGGWIYSASIISNQPEPTHAV